MRKKEGDARKFRGSITTNNGYWCWCGKLPGEVKRRKIPLCAPGADVAMRSDRPRELAVAAALRMWDAHTRAARLAPTDSRTVNAICDAYLSHSQEYYNGSGEVGSIACALRPLREMFGTRPVGELVHTDILRYRDALVRHGYARRTVNRYVRTICGRMIPWAFDEGLVLAHTREELVAPMPLKRGRCAARETMPVMPVDDETIRRTIAAMMPNTADMVRVHRLTGMRPAEICAMTWDAIDTTRTPWIYRPNTHKNAWRGEFGLPRVICIGKRAREILGSHRQTAHPFSPIAAVAEAMLAKRAARTSPFYPCRDEHYTRAKANPERAPGEAWNTQSYSRTIHAACQRAAVRIWSANQLRHAFATQVRREFGLESCRAVLGHSMGASVTDRYSFAAIEDEIIAKASPAVEALG